MRLSGKSTQVETALQKFYSIFSIIVIIAAVLIMMPGILDFLRGLSRFALLISSAIALSAVAALLITAFKKSKKLSAEVTGLQKDQKEIEP